MTKYLHINNGTVEYPFSVMKLKKEHPNVSFPQDIPDRLLADYNVFPVVEAAPPSVTIYKKAVEGTPTLVNGKWTQKWSVVNADVPTVITPRQCRLVLMQQGLLQTVEAMIAQQDQATKITWEYALEFRRDDPILTQLAANLGLTSQQVDEFFIAASQIS